MEKEKLSAQLAELVGENSLSERTWSDYLDNSVMPFLPAGEPAGEFLDRHANVLKSINGQLNNEIASKVNEFKKNYKPEPVKPDTVPEPQPDIKDNKLRELESRLLKFEKQEAEKAERKTREQKLNGAKKLMKEQGASHEAVLELIVPQLTVDADTDIVELARAGKEMYDKAYSNLFSESYIPAQSGSLMNFNKKNSKDAYLKRLKETGRITD